MFRENDVRGCLPVEVDQLVARLDVVDSVDSTNSRLMAATAPRPGFWHAIIADEQTAGRGRGDNGWHSAPGAGLWMSAAHTFETPPRSLAPLTIALGIGLADELETLGATGIRLKWPNDFIVSGGKLGGMLVEAAASGRTVVCGIGLNFSAPDKDVLGDRAALPPTGLAAAMRDLPSRAELAARCLCRAAEVLPRFAEEGLAPWKSAWPRYDWLHGHKVRVTDGTPGITGVARGIGDDGALIIADGDEEFRVVSGSIRRLDDPGAQ